MHMHPAWLLRDNRAQIGFCVLIAYLMRFCVVFLDLAIGSMLDWIWEHHALNLFTIKCTLSTEDNKSSIFYIYSSHLAVQYYRNLGIVAVHVSDFSSRLIAYLPYLHSLKPWREWSSAVFSYLISAVECGGRK